MTLEVLLETHAVELLAGLVGFLTLLSLVQLVLYRRLAGQFRRYRALVEKAGPQGLGDALATWARMAETLETRIAEIRRRQRELERELQTCVRTPGVVRFNAFDDVGSDLSYSCALLDAKGNGVVLSGLFGRHEARTYAKPVKGGESSYHLTDEEKEAIGKVRGE